LSVIAVASAPPAVFPWLNVLVNPEFVLVFITLTVGVPVTVNPVMVGAFHRVWLPVLEVPVIDIDPPLNAKVLVFELELAKPKQEAVKPPRSKDPLVSVRVDGVVRALDSVHPPPTPSKVTLAPKLLPFTFMVLPVVVALKVVVPV
jgi:hypothetical protein